MQLRHGLASLRIERGEIEIVHFTDAVNEGTNTGQHACTISSPANPLPHVLAHFADQPFRQVDTGAPRNLA
ncbi:MAG TPA: hypothetical protein VKG02_10110, partial [Blastocatellia bacterium]|nr:hypothetical protein [Blastocatellia bacterium]